MIGLQGFKTELNDFDQPNPEVWVEITNEGYFEIFI